MKNKKNSPSSNIKITLFLIAIVIGLGTLYYTQLLVKELQLRERKNVELYAKSIKFIITSANEGQDHTFVFDNIIKKTNFPLILTNSKKQVDVDRKGFGINNILVDSTLENEQIKIFLQNKVNEFSQINQPIPVAYNDSIIMGYIFYGNSKLVESLQFYPYLQIISAVIFIVLAYVGFNYVKKNEESNIWVGMAKETAHQLGTPISSLMGWTEMLQINYKDPKKVSNTLLEIQNDIVRLNKITKRFSKIGSMPELSSENIYIAIERVVEYFRKRLPHLSKNVSIKLYGGNELTTGINIDLFEWVLENIIKNALDAIEHRNGQIEFNIFETNNFVTIDLKDNGKGIDSKNRNNIFRPGYSTKKRGWGLGLSLSKRIIENYHGGKIFIKDTLLNEGTTIRILLPK